MTLSYSFLQHYWFFIDALLGALLVFLLFVQGGQTFIFSLGKTTSHKSLIINTLGRKWEFTFTTLVTFGGAFFASFPLFYASSFGGAYWVWTLILIVFILQAVSYEFRSKANNFLGQKTYDAFLWLNGVLGPILLGTAVATFFTGSQFSLSNMNSVTWEGPLRGLEAAFSLHNLSLGFAVFFLARTNALLYFQNAISEKTLNDKIQKWIVPNALAFLVCFLTFVIWLLLREGYAVDPLSKAISLESYKYLHNLLELPVVAVVFLVGVVFVLYGLFEAIFQNKASKSIWKTGLGTVLTVLGLLLVSAFNNTSFYPSSSHLQSSLTLENASSSYFTLQVMSVVSLLVPFVVAYIWWAWRRINNKQLTVNELENGEGHLY